MISPILIHAPLNPAEAARILSTPQYLWPEDTVAEAEAVRDACHISFPSPLSAAHPEPAPRWQRHALMVAIWLAGTLVGAWLALLVVPKAHAQVRHDLAAQSRSDLAPVTSPRPLPKPDREISE